jgi:1,4-dihydroxy-2-naphthoate octaprenyltransferase
VVWVILIAWAAIAWAETGVLHWGYALLSGVGLVIAHAAVDTLNDYFDYKSGIDLETNRTPFSGGSGAIPTMLATTKEALWFAIVCLLVIVPVGIYFSIVSGPALIPLLLAALFMVVCYSPVILKCWWPEWSPGLGLGTLPVLGMYFVQTGAYDLHVLIASVPSFILVHNLLLLNEFPDVEADRKAGRKTLPITAGKKGAAVFYSVMTGLVYVWIAGAVIAGQMPVLSLLALLTLPLAVKAIRGSMHYDDMSRLGPAMAANVMVVLFTQLLLGIGYVLTGVFS